jgi:hypothetical protein
VKPVGRPSDNDPKPIPAPEARRKIAVEILPVTKPPSRATPAGASRSSGTTPASDRTQTTST